MARKKLNTRNNASFLDNLLVNDLTYIDYLERFKKIALSIFEWVNLPASMNSMWLEKCLYYNGQASLLKDKYYGFINTKCCTNGKLNIYGLPTSLHCYSYEYQTNRKLYTGLPNKLDIPEIILPENKDYNECILVMNNWERTPTAGSMELFAYRLYEAQRTCDVNIKAQKTPVFILINDKQRLTFENLYSQIDGNKPVVFGDKDNLGENVIKAINTQAPYVTDKVTDYKKRNMERGIDFLGINNIMVNKKERLITDEANSNNELINLNLQSYLAPRQEACRQFNEKFGLSGTDKEISVRVRSDLHNIIKNAESIVNDYKKINNLDNEINIEGGEDNE